MSEPPINIVASPCVRNCCLDDHDICLGCLRHISEIVGWQDKNNAEKQAILVKCQERRVKLSKG